MKAQKLVKTKKSKLKVPVTTAGRKMQFFRNSNSSAAICKILSQHGHESEIFQDSNDNFLHCHGIMRT